MKNITLTIILAVFAAFGTACGQSENRNSNSETDHSKTDHSKMDHSKMDHSKMDHSEMKSSPDAASAPYDLQFIDTMIAHHQGAVDMGKMINERTNNAEMKKFGEQIIADQEKEINQMKEFREKWFAGKPPALNMEMPGMKESMDMDMKKLTESKDKDFDLAFIEMMIPHHEGAVTMSKEALQKSEKEELKTLANQIIKAQEAEIKMMKEWQSKWAK